ncbi:helix-turn-helix domain-containing protein [Sedimentitalea xiamensis]
MKGWPVAGIARRLRITDITVRKHLKRYGPQESMP